MKKLLRWTLILVPIVLVTAVWAVDAVRQVELADKRAFEAQPDSVFEAMLKEAPIVLDGQILHPKVQYNLQARAGEDMAARREGLRQVLLNGGLKRSLLRGRIDELWNYRTDSGAPMKSIHEVKIQGLDSNTLDARIYIPNVASGEESLPVLLYFHGGGFIFASLDAVHGPVQLMANEAQVIVVSVNYRLAPEHTYPAANRDAMAAWQWARTHVADFGGNPELIAVGGDSAGAYLSVATSLALRERGEVLPAAQLLYYPVVDVAAENYPSWHLFGADFGLDKHFIRVASELYVPDEKQREDIKLSPIRESDLSGLPPAIIVSAGFDPLRDQARAYAQKLDEHGVSASYINAASLHHGFLESSGTINDAGRIARQSAALLGIELRR